MLRIALYGTNGHQLPTELPADIRARVVAAAGVPAERLHTGIRPYDTLDDLLADPKVDLVSLCSPCRAEQAAEARRCLRAGKHVLAEKPGAFTNDELDALLIAERETGRCFREMLDHSLLEPNVRAMRRLVEAGVLGEIVQVTGQKSYPWMDWRPRDFATDGGLIRQAGIHGTRFIVGATGKKITAVRAAGTAYGLPEGSACHLAAVLLLELEGGALASLTVNYLNPPQFGTWGNEHLRLHGTRGMVESVDGFTRHRLYLNDRTGEDLTLTDDVSRSYLVHYINYLLDATPFPTPRPEELNPLRAVIAAHQAALTGERVPVQTEEPLAG